LNFAMLIPTGLNAKDIAKFVRAEGALVAD
jgi:hypothetical protein